MQEELDMLPQSETIPYVNIESMRKAIKRRSLVGSGSKQKFVDEGGKHVEKSNDAQV